MKKIMSILAVLVLATACIYPYQPDLENAPEGVLVVDGNLIIGENSTVRIGFMESLWPKNTEDSSGSTIYYSNDALVFSVRVWAEDDGGGVYEGTLEAQDSDSLSGSYSNSFYSASIPYAVNLENAPGDRSYRVCVQAGDLLYTSDWTKPLAPPVLKKITFKVGSKDKSDVLVGITLDGGPEATGYVLLSFEETWKFHADYYPYYEYDPASNSVSDRVFTWDHYWCWKSMDWKTTVPVDFSGMTTTSLKDYNFYSFSRYDNRNHQRYSILVKARTVDKKTYQYLQHLEESTESGDNLFTPNPGEIAGNLRCETDPDRMVLGFVTVARSTSLRSYLGGQYLLTKINYGDLVYPLPTPEFPDQPAWRDFYEMGYLPLIENPLAESDPRAGPYGWGREACYDCIAAGGTQVKPDFWEDR